MQMNRRSIGRLPSSAAKALAILRPPLELSSHHLHVSPNRYSLLIEVITWSRAPGTEGGPAWGSYPIGMESLAAVFPPSRLAAAAAAEAAAHSSNWLIHSRAPRFTLPNANLPCHASSTSSIGLSSGSRSSSSSSNSSNVQQFALGSSRWRHTQARDLSGSTPLNSLNISANNAPSACFSHPADGLSQRPPQAQVQARGLRHEQPRRQGESQALLQGHGKGLGQEQRRGVGCVQTSSLSSRPMGRLPRVLATKTVSDPNRPQGLTLYPKPSLGSCITEAVDPGGLAEVAEEAHDACVGGVPAGTVGWRSTGRAGQPPVGALGAAECDELGSVKEGQSDSSATSSFSSSSSSRGGNQGGTEQGLHLGGDAHASGTPGGYQDSAATTGRMLLVDGSALLYRAFYKVEARVARHTMGGHLEPFAEDEDEIGTVFAFLDIVVSLLLLWRPTHLAIVLDHPGPTFRKAMYSGYKKNRSPMPDSLRSAIPLVEVSLRACGLRLFKVPGVEADDVIATLAEESLNFGMRVRVASPDKDFFQLLCPRLSLLRPENGHTRYVRRAGAPTYPFTGLMHGQLLHFATFGEEEFRQKFGGLAPDQFVDLQALMGDKCDAVPGARGIGEKTAPKLMRKFGSLDNLLASVEEVQEKRYREALQRSHESVLLSRELVQLKKDVAHGVPLHELVLRPPHDDGQLFWELVQGLEVDSVRMGSLRHRIRELWRSLREQEAQRQEAAESRQQQPEGK